MKIIDMHCDTVSRIFQERKENNHHSLRCSPFQVDLEKMQSSGYLLQNFAVFLDLSKTDTLYQDAKEEISLFYEEMKKNQDIIIPVMTYEQILQNDKQRKMSALLTLEEGEACGGSLDKLKEFYRLGVRMMTFTWNYPNTLGYPAEPANTGDISGLSKYNRNAAICNNENPDTINIQSSAKKSHGLTSCGIEFLEEMEHLGIIPDVSHLSDMGIRDVCRFAKKPFCASHSNARSLCMRGRNLPDELIRGIALCGGVIGANYYGPFLSDIPNNKGQYYSYVKDIASHIRYISNIGGISCIGLGSDFDGIDDNIELENCSHMELLEHELHKCGFHESDIEKIFYKNVLDFYKEAL